MSPSASLMLWRRGAGLLDLGAGTDEGVLEALDLGRDGVIGTSRREMMCRARCRTRTFPGRRPLTRRCVIYFFAFWLR